MASSSLAPSSIREACKGSCHCGKTQYVAFLSFPPGLAVAVPASQGFPPNNMRIYKCNCRPCHKMGMFHVRLKSAPDDFFLIWPTDLKNGVLQDYTCNSKMVHWYFCKTCGVRCFAFMGVGETVEVNVDMLQGKRTEEGQSGRTIKVWRPKKDEWDEINGFGLGRSFLSVNAQTLEPKNGTDLRAWATKRWVCYKDANKRLAGDTNSKPHGGGCY